jgi:hypothetical protein
MFVWYNNVYAIANVNGGKLISTIIAYYLIFAVMLIPITFFANTLFQPCSLKRCTERFLLMLLGLFALYIAAQMGRRVVMVLFALAMVYWIFFYLLRNIRIFLKTKKTRLILSSLFFIVLVMLVSYWLLSDSDALRRLTKSSILHDHRFEFWRPALKIMFDNPFGGGHSIYITPKMYLAHNTWIDIGKYFGIIPFLLSIFFFFIHIGYWWQLNFSSTISTETKHMFNSLLFIAFAQLMIEPVFISDKIFFAYVIYLLGISVSVAIVNKRMKE